MRRDAFDFESAARLICSPPENSDLRAQFRNPDVLDRVNFGGNSLSSLQFETPGQRLMLDKSPPKNLTFLAHGQRDWDITARHFGAHGKRYQST